MRSTCSIASRTAPSRNSCARSAPPITSAVSARLKPDVVIECTGAGPVMLRRDEPHRAGAASSASPAFPPAATRLQFDVGDLNRTMVLENDVVFGSVNANRRHYQRGRRGARPRRQGVARRPDHAAACRWRAGARRSSDGPDDIKVVVDFARLERRRWHRASKTTR